MKLKVRNGYGFDLGKIFKNGNGAFLRLDTLEWGLGFNLSIGDSGGFIKISVACLHFEIWF